MIDYYKYSRLDGITANVFDNLHKILTNTHQDLNLQHTNDKLSSYLELEDNVKLSDDKKEISFNIGPYFYVILPTILLSNEKQQIVISTYENVTQIHRLLPSGIARTDLIKSLTISYDGNKWQLVDYQPNSWRDIVEQYIDRLIKHIEEVENTSDSLFVYSG